MEKAAKKGKVPKKLKVKKPKKKKKELCISVLRKIRATKEKQKRLKIIKAIARSQVSWANEVLLHALEDSSEEIRNFIINELGNRENLDLNKVYQKIAEPPWYVKSCCLKILGIKKNTNSVKYIEAVLKEPNIDVRRTAAHALGEIGGREALELLAKLTQDKSLFVRTSAKEALKKASRLKFS